MQQKIEQLHHEADADLGRVTTTSELAAVKVKYLGRKGPIQGLMQELKALSAEERPAVGKSLNDFKNFVAERIAALEERFVVAEESAALLKEVVDVTMPGRRGFVGSRHLLMQVCDHLLEIFASMGFTVQVGPHIESDYYNFEALRMLKDHPSRDMQETFYIDAETVLRTHTSNVQIRTMEATKPPIRIVAPGKTFRNEDVSARSHFFFHQIEGLYIDRGVTFADLMGTLNEFLRRLFEKEVATRFRPSYFPFVEPGAEVDVRCVMCEGKGCSICKGSGWLEVLGAGMVHPGVLQNGGIDPEEFTGFAWGLGIERLVMMKYGIPDIRLFTLNDLRFLSQFPAV